MTIKECSSTFYIYIYKYLIIFMLQSHHHKTLDGMSCERGGGSAVVYTFSMQCLLRSCVPI